jgi:molybdopterin-guanine dinucleotide biosynthesis protein A
LTGVVLVSGASRRFGSAKAVARFGGQTLAERAWAVLGEACDERIAVGKAADRLPLPFPVLDDGVAVRAAIGGVVAGLCAARHDTVVFLPVDTPLVGAAELRRLAEACRDADVPQTGPLPGAYSKSTLAVLERRLASGRYSLRGAVPELDVAVLRLDDALLANVNTPEELDNLTIV